MTGGGRKSGLSRTKSDEDDSSSDYSPTKQARNARGISRTASSFPSAASQGGEIGSHDASASTSASDHAATASAISPGAPIPVPLPDPLAHFADAAAAAMDANSIAMAPPSMLNFNDDFQLFPDSPRDAFLAAAAGGAATSSGALSSRQPDSGPRADRHLFEQSPVSPAC